MKVFAVTGTFHGSIITALTEGEARKAFHEMYNGESIISIAQKSLTWFYYEFIY